MNLNIIEKKQQYFHGYATANDNKFYFKDLQNLIRLKNTHSGYQKIILYVAISEVRKISVSDTNFVKIVKEIFHNHPVIELREVYFKNNIGRDFSSYHSIYQKVKKSGHSNDYILFQNRSGFGPFQENWYLKFVEQFEKFDSIAICGSTINFAGLPSMNSGLPTKTSVHVQTYSLLTKVFHMNLIDNNFPGMNETDKKNVIINGEMGLSQFFLQNDYFITCIEWPNQKISNQTEPIEILDIKRKVKKKHAFYHRLYFKRNIFFGLNQITNGLSLWGSFLFQEFKQKRK